MADFDYEMTLVQHELGEVSYPSGRMIFILELREDDPGAFLNGMIRQHRTRCTKLITDNCNLS